LTFKEAKEKLLKLAKGRYSAIKYEETFLRNGSIIVECSVYIDSKSWCSGETWELVLAKLENPGFYTEEGQPE